MSRDGLLPKAFAKVHPKYRTPYVGTILTGLFVATFAAFANIAEVVDLTNIGTLFAFVLVSAGVIFLRRTEPDRVRPFRVPGVPFTPIISDRRVLVPDVSAADDHVDSIRNLARGRARVLLHVRVQAFGAAARDRGKRS